MVIKNRRVELWSISTTMRNPERIYGFLKTIKEMDGMEWNEETQKELQVRLIKNRLYKPTDDKLNLLQRTLLKNLTEEITLDQAEGIFNSKHYTDPPMRGRQTMSPIKALGLVKIKKCGKIQKIEITNFGELFLNKEISLEEVVFKSLLKYQIPNPLKKDLSEKYNTKPFINILRLIKKVNEICKIRGEKEKGVSKLEFGIFGLSIVNYITLDYVALCLLEFRKDYDNYEGKKEEFVENYISKYLRHFPNAINNIKEYSDNIIRYLRLTKYIYIRGNGYYIDLEPRRKIEINSLLKKDNGSIKEFTSEEDYFDYIGDYYSYKLPFETIEKLTIILNDLRNEIKEIENELGIRESEAKVFNSLEKIKEEIKRMRNYRQELFNLKLKRDYYSITKIEEAICKLTNIRDLTLKPSIALEKWVNISLNIINDSILIKPNYPVGDDNEPVFTAPANVPDIECFYKNFDMICEVTMLNSRSQWINEGQPVMRHLRDFEEKREKESFCLFVAPQIHRDTLNTFFISVKYEYEGKKQNIIPITISQLIKILEKIKKMRLKNKNLKSEDLKDILKQCSNVKEISSSLLWKEKINDNLKKWCDTLS